jgi:hypothetical protein
MSSHRARVLIADDHTLIAELCEFEPALEKAAMACSESHNCDLARIGGISRRSLDMLR